MTDRAVISGSYADFKLVKTRSVAAVIVEIPIEQAEAFLKVFGVPQPGAEKPVALALLNMEKQAEKPHKSWAEMSRAQQAGILCADEKFQQWLSIDPSEDGEAYAVETVRAICGVRSRAEIDGLKGASAKWDDLVSRYRTATGQQAEAR